MNKALRSDYVSSKHFSANRVYLVVLGETICANIANGMLLVALGWWFLDTPLGVWGASFVQISFFTSSLLFPFIVGRLTDRHPPTYFTRRASLIKLAVSTVLFWYVSKKLYVDYPYLIFILVFISSSAENSLNTALTSYSSKVLYDKPLARLMSVCALFLNFSFMIGAVIVGQIYNHVGLQGVVTIMFFLYIVSVGLAFSLPQIQFSDGANESESDVKIVKNKTTISDYLFHLPKINRLPLWFFCSIVFYFGIAQIFLLIYPKEYANQGIDAVGFIQAVFILGMTIATVYLWKRPVQKNFGMKLVVSQFIVTVAHVLLFFGKKTLIFPLVTYFLVGMFGGFIFLYLMRLWLTQFQLQYRGGASGIMSLTSALARIMGFVFISVFSGKLVLPQIITFMTLFMLGLNAIFLINFRKMNVVIIE